MKYGRGSFVTVPSKEVLRGIHPTAQTVYMWLCAYANETGMAFPARTTLARDCGVSPRNIDSMLEVLLKKGLIERNPRYKNNEQLTNLYTVVVKEGIANSAIPLANSAIPPSQDLRTELNPVLTQSTETGAARIEVVVVSEEDNPKRVRKDTGYYSVYELFGTPWPLDWKSNTTQINAAKNLLEEHGLQDCIEAMHFYERHREDEYCPKIRTPLELSRKWIQLEDHVDRIK